MKEESDNKALIPVEWLGTEGREWANISKEVCEGML